MTTKKPEAKSSETYTWRQERPLEDPNKMKLWGVITAQPSEYLIHYRKGKLREKTSGQGASCFKFPSDTVAIIPTTIKEVVFKANQITKDNVDVRIRGMAFYHIANPLLIYKRINFSFRERAEEKLANSFADLCRSYAKWLVANMTVEEAIRKRKEEIATTLRMEVEKVVIGDNGWGVVIDTIDIQDIYIESDEIFQSLQQDYKSRTKLEADRSRIEMEHELKKWEIEKDRALGMLRIESEQEIREQEIARKKTVTLLQTNAEAETKEQDLYHKRKAASQQAAAEAETKELEISYKKKAYLLQIAAETEAKVQGVHAAEKLHEAEKEKESRELVIQSQYDISVIQRRTEQDTARIVAGIELAKQKLEQDRAAIEAKRSLEAAQLELDRIRVEFNSRLALEKAEADVKLETIKAEQALRTKHLALQSEVEANNEQVRLRRSLHDIDNDIGDKRLQEVFITQSLPKIAEAFATQFAQINYTQISGGEPGASPLGGFASVFNQLLEVAKLHGINLATLFARDDTIKFL